VPDSTTLSRGGSLPHPASLLAAGSGERGDNATEELGCWRELALGNRESWSCSPGREPPPWMNDARPGMGEAVGGSSGII
jgi:hypothetical protein